MLKKNGESSVGGAMLIGCAATTASRSRAEASRASVSSVAVVASSATWKPRRSACAFSVARSPASSGDGLTSSVPMPSGALSPPSPRMLRTIAMCARGSATPRRCSAAVASAVMR